MRALLGDLKSQENHFFANFFDFNCKHQYLRFRWMQNDKCLLMFFIMIFDENCCTIVRFRLCRLPICLPARLPAVRPPVRPSVHAFFILVVKIGTCCHTLPLDAKQQQNFKNTMFFFLMRFVQFDEKS